MKGNAMNIDLIGRTAFVTGGSKGIGKAFAETLADCGANVGVIARGKDELEVVVAALNSKHSGRALALQGDVSSYEQVSEALRRTAQHFGGLHLAVNNAGIAGKSGLLHETGQENWRRIMGINLDGVAYAMMTEIAEMMKAGGGSIVNIASVEAHTILKENPVYTASKHALIGLTKGTAADYAEHGIRINSVSPGVIRTPLTMADDKENGDGSQRASAQEPRRTFPRARLYLGGDRPRAHRDLRQLRLR
jgi:NAD(P)-dependent dehydrogenase (short-subunit alcohol dehydrogenase family)